MLILFLIKDKSILPLVVESKKSKRILFGIVYYHTLNNWNTVTKNKYFPYIHIYYFIFSDRGIAINICFDCIMFH